MAGGGVNGWGDDLGGSSIVGSDGRGRLFIGFGCLGPPTLELLSLGESSAPLTVPLCRCSPDFNSFGRVS